MVVIALDNLPNLGDAKLTARLNGTLCVAIEDLAKPQRNVRRVACPMDETQSREGASARESYMAV